MNTLIIIILTLIIYSAISWVSYWLSKEDDDILVFFGMGIIGWILLFVFEIVKRIQKCYKNYSKRSIIEETTGLRYQCRLKDTDDIIYWRDGYKLIKRYAPKTEWKDLPVYSKEFIEECKRNCDNCKYYDECRCDFPYDEIKCKHDVYGRVLEFDKFEKE